MADDIDKLMDLTIGDIVQVQFTTKGITRTLKGPVVFCFPKGVRPALQDVCKYYEIAATDPRIPGLLFTPITDRLVLLDEGTKQFHVFHRNEQFITLMDAEISVIRPVLRRRKSIA